MDNRTFTGLLDSKENSHGSASATMDEWNVLLDYCKQMQSTSFEMDLTIAPLPPAKPWTQLLGMTQLEPALITSQEEPLVAEATHEMQNISLNSAKGQQWLWENCEKFVQEVADSPFTAAQLHTEIMRILEREGNVDLENSLVALLGFTHMEFLSDIVSNRQTILDETINPKSRSDKPSSFSTGLVQAYQKPKFEEQLVDKKYLSDKRVNIFSNTSGGSLRKAVTVRETYPNVYDDIGKTNLAMMLIESNQMALPVGTTRRDTGEFEEVSLPMAVSASERHGHIPLISIEQMEKWVKPVYKNYKSLNLIQSIVYPVAYGTNENMLVCAPTGAGKTDVALLTMLSTIKQYIFNLDQLSNDDTSKIIVDKSQFKIIYVAPMKALATEITRKFSDRLQPLGLKVREWTGDMQLSRSEVQSTTVLVTTPEKFDVVSRKASTSVDLKIKLLILDEVHLLHDDRGSVLEAIVARILRQVESSQSMIRIVGLSATLPNYLDVADFLRVNPQKGLFFFGNSFRPVPLQQTFVGVKGGKPSSNMVQDRMNKTAYERTLDVLIEGRQVMIFVHSRKQTANTAYTLLEIARENDEFSHFEPNTDTLKSRSYQEMLKDLQKSRNRELRELAIKGVGIHHAGMLRSDRLFVEKYFGLGHIKVLVCTATLAWGVNLPAYSVIIKGTQIFDAEKGGFMDLSILDVMQIFGRAGRPQFEPNGLATIITSHDKLSHYISRMASQLPIESKFNENLIDNLNAEITSTGTVSNVDEAIQWLGYTYLYVRMRKNPTVYGLQDWDPALDPNLLQHRRNLCVIAAKKLAQSQMIVYNESSGLFYPKEFGRIAAQYYISSETVEIFNQSAHQNCSEADIIHILACAKELDNIKLRESEYEDLKKLVERDVCPCESPYGPDHEIGKRSLLIQAYISRYNFDDFGLISDMNYISQNTPRLLRAFFEMSLRRCWGPTTHTILSIAKSVERRSWFYEHPLTQFALSYQLPGSSITQRPALPMEIVARLKQLPETSTQIDELRQMSVQELGSLFRNNKHAENIAKCLSWLPYVTLDARLLPITRTVLKVDVLAVREFTWNNKIHGSADTWWLWIEDSESTEIYAHEILTFTPREDMQKLTFMIPASDPPPAQIYVRAVSDRWNGMETLLPLSINDIVLPESASPHTNLLNLHPLPVSAVQDESTESYFKRKFSHFNPVQTQTFHTLFYNTGYNVLLGAPTGSGKTVCAELAMFSAFKNNPNSKVVYIAPLKSLVRERVDDWGVNIPKYFGRKVVELTGDATPDAKSIQNSDLIITTPEKFDGVSRNWKIRSYVKSISLVIMDEIHLLGSDRGPTLEVIVSRMNFIGFHTNQKIRLVGLSTALSNATDLASWLDVHPKISYYNFRHSVRPVPLEVYIDAFSGRHYCPRMATMNKPIYNSIVTHSPDKPVLVFVSSRRQTRLTAQDLIAFCANNVNNPRRFLKMDFEMIDEICETQISDLNLKLSLTFGIGLHHAGLSNEDRVIVERLFTDQKIQVLIATSTVAWGVNFPAHLVIVKGTEFFDGKTQKYVDYPITDVLQMMGRAGRPQFDDSGVAHILVHDQKKAFYKKFLHEPFPVESSLHDPKHLINHLNAELVAGTIKTPQDAAEYLTWTYFYRRLRLNPSYYGLVSDEHDETRQITVSNISQKDVNKFISQLVDNAIAELTSSGCLARDDQMNLISTPLANISSYYYLSHLSIRVFMRKLNSSLYYNDILGLVASAVEYEEFPVRHNEDLMNEELAKQLRFKSIHMNDHKPNYLSPHEKVFLLLQCHLSRFGSQQMPIADYVTDMKSALDQTVRILQAVIDVACEMRLAKTAMACIELMQCIKSACWWDEDPVRVLKIRLPQHQRGVTLPELLHDDLSIKKMSKQDRDIMNHLPIIIPKSIVREKNDSNTIIIDLQIEQRLPQKKIVKENEVERYAYAPFFSKRQPEGVVFLAMDKNKEKILAMKRVLINKLPMKQKITLKCDDSKKRNEEMFISIMSDCYLGMDQEYSV